LNKGWSSFCFLDASIRCLGIPKAVSSFFTDNFVGNCCCKLIDLIMKLVYYNDIQVRWRYYQKVINQTGLSLSDIMDLLDIFLRPVFDSLLSGNNLNK